MNRVN